MISRELTYEDRCALFDIVEALRGPEFSLLLAMRSTYAGVAEGALRFVRADIENALKKLDAAEARLKPEPALTAADVIDIADVRRDVVEQAHDGAPLPVRGLPRDEAVRQ